MKLPRWLVATLLTLSLLPLLTAGAWWWFTWPEKTGRDFARLIVAKSNDADAIVGATGPNNRLFNELCGFADQCEFTVLECGSRAPSDLLVGRQQFQLVGLRPMPMPVCGVGLQGKSEEEIRPMSVAETTIRFTVERGRINESIGLIYSRGNSQMLMLDGTYRKVPVDPNWPCYRIDIAGL